MVAETVLYASTPSELETRIEFADSGTEGIALTWEADDTFVVYEGDKEVGVFTCLDAESGKFRSDAVLTNGVTYTAKYGKAEEAREQNGDEINHLDAACAMTATFTYGSYGAITFEHDMAIITFKFESTERPAKLVFDNGAERYSVTYSAIKPVDGLYTSHIMVNPCDATERTLAFSLYAAGATEAYDVHTVSTSKAYVAGYRYTALVSKLERCAWSGKGSGTESDPYLVSTAELLRELSANVNSGMSYDGRYFLMTNDIDLGGIDSSGKGVVGNEFTAIGYYASASDNSFFQGTFDGGDHKVLGLYINQAEKSFQGLFGRVYCAKIKDLGVDGLVVGSRYAGGVVGYASQTTIISCYSTGEVSGHSLVGGVVGWAPSTTISKCYKSGKVSGYDIVGGVAGYTTDSSVLTECYNSSDVSGIGYNVGGVVGSAYSTTMKSCYNTGDVSGDSYYIGGVAGRVSDFSSVTLCHNTGNVSSSYSYDGYLSVGGVAGIALESDIVESYNSGMVSGKGNNIGGVVGSMSTSSNVKSSYNVGEVSGYSSLGGIVGRTALSSSVISCCNRGKVSGRSDTGGVVGYALKSTVNACYNTGAVSGSSNTGGVIGYVYSYSNVTSCYSAGVVSEGEASVGGVFGYVDPSVSVVNGYYDLIVSRDHVAVGVNYGKTTNVEGKITADMTSASFITTLNTATDEDYWIADSKSINSGYPILNWQ